MRGFQWEMMFQRWLMPPYDIILVGLAILLLVAVVFLVVLFLVLRARRRERMISSALAAGQPELALYVAQGPRRIVAFLVLLGAGLLASYGWDMHAPEVYPVALIVAVICLVVIFKRPKVRTPSAPTAPPGAQAAQQAPPTPLAPESPLAPPSNGIVETILAAALAILVIIAGLILLRFSAAIVLIAGVIGLVYLASSHERRSKFFRAVGRQTGKFQQWLNRKAGNGDTPS